MMSELEREAGLHKLYSRSSAASVYSMPHALEAQMRGDAVYSLANQTLAGGLGQMAKMRWLLWLVLGAGVIGGLFAAYAWLALSWSYSEGERAGYVQKLSHKGWACKTWEGELAMVSMPGTLAEKFFFSVRDGAVAQSINQSLGKRVALTYQEHVGIPTSCFGETRYYITAVRVVEEKP